MGCGESAQEHLSLVGEAEGGDARRAQDTAEGDPVLEGGTGFWVGRSVVLARTEG